MVTEEEKKLVRAYNIGLTLAQYEPRLLSDIIKQNPNNEFVKTLALAKDHQEFRQNIPRKDFTPNYKNAYYNSQTLYERNPTLLNRMLASKDLDKDFNQGLQDGKKNLEIKSLQKKNKNEPKIPEAEYKQDFKKGFNHGYALSENNWELLKYVTNSEKRWGAYVEGLKAGDNQYMKDAEIELAKHKQSVTKPPGRKISEDKKDQIRNIAENLNELASEKLDKLDDESLKHLDADKIYDEGHVQEREQELPDTLLNYLPPWLKEDRFDSPLPEPDKDDIEPDR